MYAFCLGMFGGISTTLWYTGFATTAVAGMPVALAAGVTLCCFVVFGVS